MTEAMIAPFYISSRGHSATAWLATMLSKHPEVVCFHGTRSIPPYDSGTVPDMSPEQFVEALDMCAMNSKGKVFGAVHGFYGAMCKEAVEQKGGRFAAIIRHPVKRIHSCFLHSCAEEIYGGKGDKASSVAIYDFIKERGMDRVQSRLNQAGELYVSDVEKAFFHYCNSLIHFDLECLVAAGKELNFRMEDLVVSPEEFVRLFSFITAGKLPCDSSYLDGLDFKTRINQHSKSYAVEEIYEAWPTSFKFLFHKALEINGGEGGRARYAEMDYELPQGACENFDMTSF